MQYAICMRHALMQSEEKNSTLFFEVNSIAYIFVYILREYCCLKFFFLVLLIRFVEKEEGETIGAG